MAVGRTVRTVRGAPAPSRGIIPPRKDRKGSYLMHESTTYLLIIGAAVVALAALAAIVNNVVSIVRGLRRDPPLPEELAKDYATKREISELKAEVKAERERIDKILAKQFDLIRSLTAENTERFNTLISSIGDWQRGVERMIGRIEGKVNQK